MEYTGWCENGCISPGLQAPQVLQWKKSSGRPVRQMPHASQWNIPVFPARHPHECMGRWHQPAPCQAWHGAASCGRRATERPSDRVTGAHRVRHIADTGRKRTPRTRLHSRRSAGPPRPAPAGSWCSARGRRGSGRGGQHLWSCPSSPPRSPPRRRSQTVARGVGSWAQFLQHGQQCGGHRCHPAKGRTPAGRGNTEPARRGRGGSRTSPRSTAPAPHSAARSAGTWSQPRWACPPLARHRRPRACRAGHSVGTSVGDSANGLTATL
jgi:hypothetical protein